MTYCIFCYGYFQIYTKKRDYYEARWTNHPSFRGHSLLFLMCLFAPWHVGSFWIKTRTHVSCIDRWILYCRASREAFIAILISSIPIYTGGLVYQLLIYSQTWFLGVSETQGNIKWKIPEMKQFTSFKLQTFLHNAIFHHPLHLSHMNIHLSNNPRRHSIISHHHKRGEYSIIYFERPHSS